MITYIVTWTQRFADPDGRNRSMTVSREFTTEEEAVSLYRVVKPHAQTNFPITLIKQEVLVVE